MNIFIDTNILLSFYHLSSDDLEELKKLGVLLRQKKVTLWLPEQTIVEFKRNRANKIANALKRLEEQRINMQFPQLSKEYDEYLTLREQLKDAEKNYSKLIENIRKDIETQNLKADHIIQELMSLTSVIPSDQKLVDKARLRYEIGNPPGKKDSLGDAINWEALLENVPPGEELSFISDDKDYTSPLDNNSFDPFLLDEWKRVKGTNLVFYKRLSSFFKDKFPQIKLASELEKDLLIRELINSSSFAQTHSVVSKLSNYTDFSPVQANEIVIAAISNNQIHWIIEDSDINVFLKWVLSQYSNAINTDNAKYLETMLQGSNNQETDPFFDETPDEDLPF